VVADGQEQNVDAVAAWPDVEELLARCGSEDEPVNGGVWAWVEAHKVRASCRPVRASIAVEIRDGTDREIAGAGLVE